MFSQGPPNPISFIVCTDRLLHRRMATSMRKRIIHDFQSQLFKTCGIRTLVLTAYEGENQELKVGMCVFHAFPSYNISLIVMVPFRDDVETLLNDGKSFFKFCPEWKDAVLWQEWVQFSMECFSDGHLNICSCVTCLHAFQIPFPSLKSRSSRMGRELSVRKYPLLRMMPGAPSFHLSRHRTTIKRRLSSLCCGSIAPLTCVSVVLHIKALMSNSIM